MRHTLWNTNMQTVVVLSACAGKTEVFAAEELSSYLNKMSGKPVVISDRLHDGMVNILVGQAACTGDGFTPDGDLTDDGFMVGGSDYIGCGSSILVRSLNLETEWLVLDIEVSGT